jgi:hypothetical protein
MEETTRTTQTNFIADIMTTPFFLTEDSQERGIIIGLVV